MGDLRRIGRAEEVLRLVTIGTVTHEQRIRLQNLIREKHCAFALNLSDIEPTDLGVHNFEVEHDAKLPMRPRRVAFSQPEKEALFAHVENNERAGIIRKISHNDVRCVSDVILAPKKVEGMTRSDEEMEEILSKLLAQGDCEGGSGSDPGIGKSHQKTSSELPASDATRVRGVTPPDAPPVSPAHGDLRRGHDAADRVTGSGFTARTLGRAPSPTDLYRVVHDFRPLNKRIRCAPYLPGNLHDLVAKHSGKRYLLVLDQMGAFFGYSLAKEVQPFTAFYVPDRGYYCYQRMPQGLSGSPATQQVGAASLVAGTPWDYWMDDFFTSTNEFEQGFRALSSLLDAAIKHKVRFSPKKTKLFVASTTLGGQVVSEKGVEPDKAKVEAIRNLTTPTTALQLIAFVNKCGYFRAMIKDFSLVASPLLELLRGLNVDDRNGRGKLKRALADKEIVEEMKDPARKHAFEKLKAILCEYPVVHPPIYGAEPFEVAVDASAKGFGAHLYQTVGGRMRTIAYASKLSTPVEATKHSFKLELAATKWALDKFRPLIFGQKVILHTDCTAVRGLLNSDKLSFEQVGWKDAIFQTNIIDYRHKPGKQNVVADYLSRNATEPGPEVTDEIDTKGVRPDILWIEDDSNQELRRRFEGDAMYPVVAFLSRLVDSQADIVKRKAQLFWIADGQLWTRNAVTKQSLKVLTAKEGWLKGKEAHDGGGHWGVKRTRADVEKEFTWATIGKDLRKIVETCETCLKFGPKTRQALMWSTARYAPFEMIAMDYLSMPASLDNQRVALVAVDVFSKFIWVWTFDRAASADTTLTALTDLRQRYCLPKEIVTDNGSPFVNSKVREWLKGKVELIQAAPYAHVGLAENANHLVLDRLRRIVQADLGELDVDKGDPGDIRTWTLRLQGAVTALNDRRIEQLGGYSPREILFGRLDEKLVPIELQEALADRRDLEMTATNSRDEDIEARAQPQKGQLKPFEVGQLVQRYDGARDEATHDTAKKLRKRWTGPYRVAAISRSSVTLVTPDGAPAGRCGFDRLRAWKGVWRTAMADVLGE
ncbi:hypothetical protein FFLO_04709 [Filobasidium floriforme]|uniref:Integrase catalytic domain-containing protein n=1 Tax=Filobasidium floriforme TaxID=5210 RepID=A0A8K0NS13_9TREE|nr:hypothetical protein FFLO_04709 [Filobasidium floriforme]